MATHYKLRMLHNILRRADSEADTQHGMNALQSLFATPEGYGLCCDAHDAARRLRLKLCRYVTAADFEGEGLLVVRELTNRYREEVKRLAEERPASPGGKVRTL